MSIYSSAFQHGRRKKDNTHQIKIKIRIPDFNFQADFPIEYLTNGKKYKLSLSVAEWNNRSNKANKIIEKAKFRYDECVSYLLKSNSILSTKSINSLYKKNIFDFTRDIQIEELKRLLGYSLPDNLIEEYEDQELIEIAKNIEIGTDEELQEDEIGDRLLDAESKLRFKRQVEQTKQITDNLERCDAQYSLYGYPDFTKIIDVFGYYWSVKRINGKRYLTKYDHKIILRIAEYIFITNESNKLVDFNKNWVNNFFLYLRDFGFVDTRKVRDYTPLELYNYRNVIVDRISNRKPYQESSYDNLIKKFKRYYNLLLSETDHLSTIPKINFDQLNLESLKLADANYDEEYTQKDHYVDVDELKKMLQFKSNNDDLNLARDIFFIQVFSSGNRSIDKDVVSLKTYKGKEYIEVQHSKTNTTNNTGIFKPLKLILQSYGNQFPKIRMVAKDYNRYLKAMAYELKLERDIEFVSNLMNSPESVLSYKPLYKCISQYFSRHTLVNYLVDGGISDHDIIEITGHVSTDILKHYKKKNTVLRKQKIIDLADNELRW